MHSTIDCRVPGAISTARDKAARRLCRLTWKDRRRPCGGWLLCYNPTVYSLSCQIILSHPATRMKRIAMLIPVRRWRSCRGRLAAAATPQHTHHQRRQEPRICQQYILPAICRSSTRKTTRRPSPRKPPTARAGDSRAAGDHRGRQLVTFEVESPDHTVTAGLRSDHVRAVLRDEFQRDRCRQRGFEQRHRNGRVFARQHHGLCS